MRAVRVFKLDVTYPPGSLDLGWEPEGWAGVDYQVAHGDDAGSWETTVFQWPAERHFLSASGAETRAALLRGWGADVTVRPSLPVQWPVSDGAS